VLCAVCDVCAVCFVCCVLCVLYTYMQDPGVVIIQGC